MKYTEHYQLNQWDAADRVLREDFNRDNQKIDTALEETLSLIHICWKGAAFFGRDRFW